MSFLSELRKPITAEIGLSDPERQAIYNLARRQTQGSTRAAAEGMREIMGGRGFRAGDSGIADTAIGNILSQGAERLGQFSSQVAINERNRRFEENMALNNANLQRLLGGAGIVSQRQATAASAGSAAARLKFDKRRWRADQQQQQFENLYRVWGSMSGQQGQDWDRYAGEM